MVLRVHWVLRLLSELSGSRMRLCCHSLLKISNFYWCTRIADFVVSFTFYREVWAVFFLLSPEWYFSAIWLFILYHTQRYFLDYHVLSVIASVRFFQSGWKEKIWIFKLIFIASFFILRRYPFLSLRFLMQKFFHILRFIRVNLIINNFSTTFNRWPS